MNVLGSFRDAPGTDTGGAYTNLFAGAVNDSANAAQVGIPAAARDVVRVADGIAITRLLAADFTSECHVSIAPDWKDFRRMRTLMLTENRMR